ncbi:DUF4924 family protein [Fulvivirga lutea]|uniref:DUF4924 family protein n=1 Tax=Fulvivirga lutea TaxID=2810512 RepID=A0A974WHF7_9BACT|nr:DUF4924 family protein [Fulvivirga lutea]QSE97297.1 DUF4924 family protein [Fulvivirga lutea]
MNIAEKKRQNNIAEYIIHMYQSEDLIRAFECDIDKVKEYVLKHIPTEGTTKKELEHWYQQLLERMQHENILSSGHLKETHEIVAQLDELKQELVHNDEEFKSIYTKAESHIQQMLQLAEGKINSEVQICLNGVYGLLIAKINGRDIPDEFRESIEEFGNVLSYLSYKYKQKHFLSNN